MTAALAAAMSQPEASVDAALQNLKAEKAAAEAAAQHAAAEVGMTHHLHCCELTAESSSSSNAV